MTRSTQFLASTLILLGATTVQAGGDLTITLGDATVAPNGTGTIDLSITSTSNDALTAFNFKLLITPEPTATSLLQFTSAQPDPTTNVNYVFAGESTFGDIGVPVVSGPTNPPTHYAGDTITGGDSDDGSTNGYVSIPATTGQLNSYLASVEFQAAPGATPGDEFEISLVAGPLTEFDDGNEKLNYSSNTGIVVVAGVPEPPSLVMLALSGLGGLLWQWRGRRSRSLAARSRMAL